MGWRRMGTADWAVTVWVLCAWACFLCWGAAAEQQTGTRMHMFRCVCPKLVWQLGYPL